MAPIAKSTLRLLLLVSVFSASSLASNPNSDHAALDLEQRSPLPQHLDSMANSLHRKHHHSEMSNKMQKMKRGLVSGLVADLGHVLVGDNHKSSAAPSSTSKSSPATPTSGSSNNGGGSSGSGSSGGSSNNDNNDNSGGSSNTKSGSSDSNSSSDSKNSNSNSNPVGHHVNYAHSGTSSNDNAAQADAGNSGGNGNSGVSGSEQANAAAGSSSVGSSASPAGNDAAIIDGASSSDGSSNADKSNANGPNRNLAVQQQPFGSSSSSGSNDQAASSTASLSSALAAATNSVTGTSSTSSNVNGNSGSTTSKTNNTANDGSSSNGESDSSPSKTSVVVPIVIVLIVLSVGGLVFWFVKKKYSNRNPRLNPIDFEPVGPQVSPRPISQESFVAGRPQSSGSYLDRPMSEVNSIGFTSTNGHGLDGFTIVPTATAGNENPFSDSQHGRMSPEGTARESAFWSATGHSHEAYLTGSEESGGIYYDGSARTGYSNSAVRGMDEAGAINSSGVVGAFSPYQDLQRGNRNSNGSSNFDSTEESSGNHSYEPYSDGPYADDEEEEQSTNASHGQNPFLGANEMVMNHHGRNSSRWSG